jgi:hypothetical protein
MLNQKQNSTIAPCGVNCGYCLAFLRDKNKCNGCWGDNSSKPKYCITCRIKNCEYLAKTSSKYCYECEKFPCTRLKQLDKRYIKSYKIGLIDNLKQIQIIGLESFSNNENTKWTCSTCGGKISIHRGYCGKCK